MNLQEFAALQEGDKIENALSNSQGVVTKRMTSGVRVVWGPRSEHERAFFYDAAGTAWFNWSKLP